MIDLTDEDGTDSKRTTSVLDSFTNNSAGVLDEIGEGNKHFFTGLFDIPDRAPVIKQSVIFLIFGVKLYFY